MEYAVISISNGSTKVQQEHIPTIEKALVKWHDVCKNFWNASDVILGAVMIVDSELRLVNGYHEIIKHEQTTTTEQTE